MKIHILFNFEGGAYGGGNQFLKALKNFLISTHYYTESADEADVILINSHHRIKELIKLKQINYNKLVIHRIDGPIRLGNKMSDTRDNLVYSINKYIADATIFQSEWSKLSNYRLGLQKKKFEATIINAPDSNIFNKNNKSEFRNSNKTKIIATSWSNNMNKGFAIYKWLDNNLDFDKYEMMFCGNSPITYNNIKHIKSLPSLELVRKLKEHDIYITASKNDACSNSLIEALHCGLPVVALKSGGNPEIVKKGGELFDKQEEIPVLLNKITENYQDYVNKINMPSMQDIGDKYLSFITDLYNENRIVKDRTKSSILVNIKLVYLLIKFKIKSKIREIIKYIHKTS